MGGRAFDRAARSPTSSLKPERAWFLQARSDFDAALLLEEHGADTCQIIMHLQMTGEKLIKAYVRRTGPIPYNHQVVQNYFIHLSRVVVGSPKLRRALMGRATTRGEVNAVLRSLERTLRSLESFNPSAAGRNAPNCEYPWEAQDPRLPLQRQRVTGSDVLWARRLERNCTGYSTEF